jgi:hypothetical protein
MADANLVVGDDEYNALGGTCINYGVAAKERFDSWNKGMNDTNSFAIYNGDTADNLRLFLLQADHIKGRIDLAILGVAAALSGYVLAIDKADKDIYNSL